MTASDWLLAMPTKSWHYVEIAGLVSGTGRYVWAYFSS